MLALRCPACRLALQAWRSAIEFNRTTWWPSTGTAPAACLRRTGAERSLEPQPGRAAHATRRVQSCRPSSGVRGDCGLQLCVGVSQPRERRRQVRLLDGTAARVPIRMVPAGERAERAPQLGCREVRVDDRTESTQLVERRLLAWRERPPRPSANVLRRVGVGTSGGIRRRDSCRRMPLAGGIEYKESQDRFGADSDSWRRRSCRGRRVQFLLEHIYESFAAPHEWQIGRRARGLSRRGICRARLMTRRAMTRPRADIGWVQLADRTAACRPALPAVRPQASAR